ncbi:MAG: hypothetical protein KJO98_11530 [Rhodothermia bacterium]|nr:hypothetical protein [Rhodothermia bacterium]
MPCGILLATLLVAACSQSPESPVEARVRAMIDQAEELAEAGDVKGFSELLSDDYKDDRGNNKQSLSMLLNYYLSAHRSIYLLTRTPQIDLPDSSSAQMVVFVAMAGSPISGVEQLGSLRADLYHFYVDAVEEDGEWRIRSSRWGRGWDIENPPSDAPGLPWRR